MKATAVVLIICALACPVSGAIDRPLVEGDVVVSGSFAAFNDTAVKIFDVTGAERGRLEGGRGEVRFAPDGSLAILDDGEIRFLRRDGTVVRRVVLTQPGKPPMAWAMSIAFTRDGAFFVSNGIQILRYSAEGVADLNDFSVGPVMIMGPPISGLDVAPDQCTLFASYLQIMALDVCGATPYRPTLFVPPGGWNVRLLPDGTFVTSLWVPNATVQRYSSNGWLVRAYTPAGRLLAVDRNPRFVWVETVIGTVQRLDLETGALVGSPIVTGFKDINGLAPVGEWRASVEGVQTIPTLSEWMLIALAVGLGAVALRRLS